MGTGYNTRYNFDSFLGIFKIGEQWWCGRDGHPGGICNIKCSSLTDDFIADDVKCVQEVIKRHGIGTWHLSQDTCYQDFKDVTKCLE